MSTALSWVPTRRRAEADAAGERAPQRRLRVVAPPARRRRPRLLYGIVALVGALSIGAAQMSLSILTTQTSYELSRLNGEHRALTWEKQILHDELAGLASPQFLAANATALGMIINESPSYLRLSDGVVLGTGAPAIGISSVDALNRGAVSNALIADTPLVTAPAATIQGVPAAPVEAEETAADDGIPNTPPPVTEGLPTPTTH